jgi:hypothetical protein
MREGAAEPCECDKESLLLGACIMQELSGSVAGELSKQSLHQQPLLHKMSNAWHLHLLCDFAGAVVLAKKPCK